MVSAYFGAAPLIANSAYPGAAGAILSTEAQHSGSIYAVCIMNGATSAAVDALDVPPTAQKPYAVDKNALSITRTPSQVVNLVYAGGGCSGGLDPNGMNGSLIRHA